MITGALLGLVVIMIATMTLSKGMRARMEFILNHVQNSYYRPYRSPFSGILSLASIVFRLKSYTSHLPPAGSLAIAAAEFPACSAAWDGSTKEEPRYTAPGTKALLISRLVTSTNINLTYALTLSMSRGRLHDAAF